MCESYDTATQQSTDEIKCNSDVKVNVTDNNEGSCSVGQRQCLLKESGSDDVRWHEARQPKHPVDSGYAWIILTATFGLKFLLVGYVKSLGIFFMEFQQRFGSNSSMISATLGIMEFVASFGSYFVMTFLIKVASPRTSCLIGSLFLVLSVAGNTWFNKVEMLCLTQGVLFGFAIALTYGPPLVSIMQYFYKHRAIASGISDCGSSCGGIVFPALCRLFLDEYSFHGGTLLTAGVMLQAFVCSSLLTPIESYSKNTSSSKRFFGKIKPLDYISNRLRIKNKRLGKSNCLQNGGLINSSVNEAKSQEGVLQKGCSNVTSGDQDQYRSLLESSHSEETPQTELTTYPRQDDIIKTNSHCTASEAEVIPLCKKSWFNCQGSVFLHSASFWVLSIFFFSGSVGAIMSQTYIPLLAAERGLSPTDSAYFLSILNFLDIPSHLLPGIIVNFGLMGAETACILPIFAVGFASCMVPLLLDYNSVLALVVIHGLFNGTFYVMQPLIIISVLGQEHFMNAMGIFIVLAGMGAAVSYPICGVLRDVTGTYSTTYIFLGMTGIFSSAILAVIPLAKRYDAKKGVLKLDQQIMTYSL